LIDSPPETLQTGDQVTWRDAAVGETGCGCFVAHQGN